MLFSHPYISWSSFGPIPPSMHSWPHNGGTSSGNWPVFTTCHLELSVSSLGRRTLWNCMMEIFSPTIKKRRKKKTHLLLISSNHLNLLLFLVIFKMLVFDNIQHLELLGHVSQNNYQLNIKFLCFCFYQSHRVNDC